VRISETRLAGPRLLQPMVHGDSRGFFLESFRADVLAGAGLDINFVQDNHSRSRHAIVRGMHFQPGQWKLVRCVRGAIVDVICDVRVGSPSFGQWEAFELNDENHHQLLIPDGFAHGFAVTSELADVNYKVSTYYDPAAEAGFRFDDPAVAIEWPLPIDELQFSARDQSAPTLAELEPDLPFRYAAAG
jgi:dTDP-4-dehydrorhamnose 3,5-epimerase